jgi:hypothetical protein
LEKLGHFLNFNWSLLRASIDRFFEPQLVTFLSFNWSLLRTLIGHSKYSCWELHVGVDVDVGVVIVNFLFKLDLYLTIQMSAKIK